MNGNYPAHYKATLKLGLPIVIGQIGIIIVGFADTVMVGHYTTESLAAASFVNNVFNLVVIALLGFSYGITPLTGALFARKDYGRAGRTFKQALAANLLFSLALTAVMGAVYFFLGDFGQPEELLPLIRPYYLTILSSVVFVALFNAMRQFTDSLMQTSAAMWILLFGNTMNILFNYLLIFGKFGFPELGVLGAGISTLGARAVMAAIFAYILLSKKRFSPYREGFRKERVSLKGILGISEVSFPVALQMGMETGTFTVSAVMVGWIGTAELASYQILVTIGTLGFMFYYSIGAAVAIRVASFSGKGDTAGVRRAAWSGYHILLLLAASASAAFHFFSAPMISGFTEDPSVAAISASLIVPLIIYQFGDATQICFANALRGTANVMSMMRAAFVSYVLVGIPCSYILGFPLGLGEKGIFLSFSTALFTAAALFLFQFLKTTNPGPHKGKPGFHWNKNG